MIKRTNTIKEDNKWIIKKILLVNRYKNRQGIDYLVYFFRRWKNEKNIIYFYYMFSI